MKHEIIPKPELKSQPVNNSHKLEFVVEYTQEIFIPKLKKVVPKLPTETTDGITEYKLLKRVYADLQRSGKAQTLYGHEVAAHEIISAGGANLNYCNMNGVEHEVFRNEPPRGLGNLITGFERVLAQEIRPLLKVCPYERNHRDWKAQYDAVDEDFGTIWLPQRRSGGLSNVVVTKKEQDPVTGEVTQVKIVPADKAKFMTKKLVSDIENHMNKGTPERDAVKAVYKEMYTFMREVWSNLAPVRTTKQLQERWPEIFDDFCAITGLGQTHGSELVPTTELSTAATLIAEYQKGRK